MTVADPPHDRPRAETRTMEGWTRSPDAARWPGNAEALARDLRRAVDSQVRFDRGSRALYATDASNYRQVPIGVVLPRAPTTSRRWSRSAATTARRCSPAAAAPASPASAATWRWCSTSARS